MQVILILTIKDQTKNVILKIKIRSLKKMILKIKIKFMPTSVYYIYVYIS